MSDNENCSGAGIILFLDNRGIKQNKIIELNDEIVFLLLEDYRGKYDFPKGAFDVGEDENSLNCAVRETKEEINLDNEEDYTIINKNNPIKNYNPRDGKFLSMYVAEMKIEAYLLNKTKILPNPHTGNLEHNDFFYVSYENLFEKDNNTGKLKMLKYLKNCAKAAKIIIDEFIVS